MTPKITMKLLNSSNITTVNKIASGYTILNGIAAGSMDSRCAQFNTNINNVVSYLKRCAMLTGFIMKFVVKTAVWAFLGTG